MMKQSLLVGGISAAMVVGFAPAALAQEGEEAAFTANIGVTSNYVWRGVTQTRNGAAVQGGVDYAHAGTGLYVGAWLSNVDFGTTEVADVLDEDGNPTGETVEYSVDAPEYELDLYAGWGWNFTDSVALDLGYVYYHYGQYGSGADFGEIYAAVSFWWFEVGAYYTTNTQIDDTGTEAFVEGDLVYYGSFGIDLAQSWSLGITLGAYNFDNDSSSNELSYAWGQIDLTKSAGRYGDFTLSLSQTGTADDLGVDDKPNVFISWNKSFNLKS